ncbi:MAG TPA: transketolase [Opitutaceae bacterium]|nr:transketolase [Opitutaceae bacterium]
MASELRGLILDLSFRGRTPHLGSSLSCADIVALLYNEYLRIDPVRPDDPDRDRFILSKGHAATTLYAALALHGFLPMEELETTYAHPGSRLPEHPSWRCVPGVEASTGSLGHGLCVGLGLALGLRIRRSPGRVFVLMSDGECNEGSVWEAAMAAPAWAINPLCAIVDFNGWQATGRSREVLALESIDRKFEAFGWRTCRVDGHDLAALRAALAGFGEDPTDRRPLAIIADTVKGRGVSFMEDDNNWHYRLPTADEVRRGKLELGLSTP